MVDNIVRCKKCITPDSLPSVSLDKDGVCNFCRRYETLDSKMHDNYYIVKKLEFEKIIKRVKKLNKTYDVLIPLSGGKDSTYALYICSKVYKLKCLCVTFDNGFLSDFAKKNIENATNAAGADHFFFRPNRNKINNLYRLFLRKSGTFCPVCMRGIEACTQLIFDKFKTPLFVTGTGRRVTYLSMIPEIFQGGDLSFFKNVMKNESFFDDLGSISYSHLSKQLNKIKELLSRLLGLHPSSIGFYTCYIALYDYFEPSYDEIRSIIVQELGWKNPDEAFEHMDCLLHDISLYIQTIRFPELTKKTLYHSNLIRLGLMSRDEAMEAESQLNREKKEPKILESFLNEIGLNKDDFLSSVRDWRETDKFRNKFDQGARRFYRRTLGKE